MTENAELIPLESIWDLSILQWLGIGIGLYNLEDFGRLWFGQQPKSKIYPPDGTPINPK